MKFLSPILVILLVVSVTAGQEITQISEFQPLPKFKAFKGAITLFSAIDNTPIHFFVGINKRDIGKQEATSIELSINSRELVFEDVGTNAQAKIQVFLRINSKSKKFEGGFGETVIIIFDSKSIKEKAGKNMQLKRTFILPKGDYVLRSFIRDSLSGKRGSNAMTFQIR